MMKWKNASRFQKFAFIHALSVKVASFRQMLQHLCIQFSITSLYIANEMFALYLSHGIHDSQRFRKIRMMLLKWNANLSVAWTNFNWTQMLDYSLVCRIFQCCIQMVNEWWRGVCLPVSNFMQKFSSSRMCPFQEFHTFNIWYVLCYLISAPGT